MANSKRKIKAWNSLWVTSEGGIYRDSECTVPITVRHNKKGRLRFKYRGQWYSVSRVIAQNFVPNPDNKPNVCHIDNDVSNNRAPNLYWGTQKENIQQALREGRLTTLFERGKDNPQYGTTAYNHKLSNSTELDLILRIKEGTHTRVQLSLEFGVSRATINNILRRHGKQ